MEVKYFEKHIEIAKKRVKENVKSISDLWDLNISKTYEEMEKEGLIPLSGDSKYVYPSLILYLNRLIYELLNNGACNYIAEYEEYMEYGRDIEKFYEESFWGRISYNFFYYLVKYVFNNDYNLAEEVIAELFEDRNFPIHYMRREFFMDEIYYKKIALLAEFVDAVVNDRKDDWKKFTKPKIY